ncbi:hypothetical protein I6F30_29800 [Bradyrhizobium sp. NBAIM20]|uniref:helix-turn-helix domain-containing protein n=1 Tax=unclassified Bradyrhizobium TaxID=2631580 RepID=UPI001CD6B006|nr:MULTISPECIES: helix-turn-helix domain-containing protein [unclassified Bradyrhizobium]MCA1415293.1 hypothetical protein [Bradyrhizobium sp. NBAIM20]MCA1461113.1 hypothetical protein [Bradyrhizobium sp. NBAIM18]
MPDTEAKQPRTFLERDDWMRAVLASDLPHVAVRVALAIGAHLHVKSGRCDPSIDDIKASSNIPKRSVYRQIALLEQAGRITLQRGGRGPGQRNQYVLSYPVSGDTLKGAKAVAGLDPAYPVTSDTLKGAKKGTLGCHTVAAHKERQAKKEREGRYISQPSDVASRDAGQDTRAPDRKPRTPKASDSPDNVSTIDLDAAFAEFWAIYPLKVGKLDAEKAYLAKAKAGTPTAVMNAGAARYAAERSGQDPKFTKHPAKWIKGECWNDEPPSTGAVTIDNSGTGNVVAEAHQEQSADDYLTQLIGPHSKNWYGT